MENTHQPPRLADFAEELFCDCLPDARLPELAATWQIASPRDRAAFAEDLRLVGALGLVADAVEPRAELKTRILQTAAIAGRAASVSATPVFAAGGEPVPSVVSSRDSAGWERWLEGVEAKVLFETAAGHRTLFLRVAAGAEFPDHDHATIEELCVLDGACTFGEIEMQTGDYYRFSAGTRHEQLRTKVGCLLLVVTHAAA